MPVTQEIFVVKQQFLEVERATFINRSSVCDEVAEARLPSAMFCLPERAACTIWSTVRERRSRNLSQNQTVASSMKVAVWKLQVLR